MKLNNKITHKGYLKLLSNQKQLKEELKQVRIELIKTRAMGDLRENQAYKALQDEVDTKQAQLVKLEEKFNNCIVYTDVNIDKEIVGFGATVELEKNNSKKILTYTIGGIYEANPEEGFIAEDSLLGSKLLGSKKNDIIKISTRKNITNEFRIVSIKYEKN